MAPSEQLASAREILDNFYAAERVFMSAPPGKRDFSAMAATLSPDHQLIQTPGLPYGGTYEGHAGFLRWAEEMTNRFDAVDVTERELMENGAGDKVVVLSKVRFRVRATGDELQYPFCQVMKFDRRRGVITEMRPFYWDVAGLNAALAKEV